MIKIVVPVSGGKDSQACLKLALQSYQPDEIIGLFCDTQFEHPLTYEHIETIRDLYQVSIMRVCAGSVPAIVSQFGQFPTSRFRMCTDRLKIKPSKDFYKDLAERQGGFQVWLGMRSGESTARAKNYAENVSTDIYPPHEFGSSFPKYLHKMGVYFRLPILDWSEFDVFDFLNGEQNPLYKMGSKRVGCFPCLASADTNKQQNFNMDATGRKHYKIVQALENETGKSVWTSKSGIIRHNKNQDDLFNGCSFCAI
jgi:3'-phosphoadenosine 5'-phosphosulfate sulfotransferase (PAPS reductase)/FAD synthetase